MNKRAFLSWRYQEDERGNGGASSLNPNPKRKMQNRRRNMADRFGTGQVDYRRFSRGGGSRRKARRNSPPQPSYIPAPPSRRRADILREAGRLAAEYLAAKGLLPSNLEKNWPNGADDDLDRTSAFSRLGRRKIDGEDSGFRRKRARRRRNRGEMYRRHVDGDDWRFPRREREFDRRSVSEESDRIDGGLDERKTLGSEPETNSNGDSEELKEREIRSDSLEKKAEDEEIKGNSDGASQVEKELKSEKDAEEQNNLPSISFKTCDLNFSEAPETSSVERETNFTEIFQQKADPPVVIDLEEEPKYNTISIILFILSELCQKIEF